MKNIKAALPVLFRGIVVIPLAYEQNQIDAAFIFNAKNHHKMAHKTMSYG
jgi:hypothetical protein